MDILVLAQTIFYFTASFAIIATTIYISIIAFYLIGLTRAINRIVNEIGDMSEDLHERLDQILEILAFFPIISFFAKRVMDKMKAQKNKVKKSKKYPHLQEN